MGPQLQNVRISLGDSLTPTVKVLIWINGLVYFFLLIASGKDFQVANLSVNYVNLLVLILGLVPQSVVQDYAFWQPITYMFVHHQFFHVLFNMLGLWWFGAGVEEAWGRSRFLRFYFFTGVGAALITMATSFLAPSLASPTAATIGASGAIFGLLVAYGFLFPDRTIYIMGIIPLRAKYCVVVFGGVAFISLWEGRASGVSHIAHLGGLACGLLWFLYQGQQNRLGGVWRAFKRKRMRRKLRLIQKKGDDEKGPFDSYSNKTLH